jgi:hypothetical protein
VRKTNAFLTTYKNKCLESDIWSGCEHNLCKNVSAVIDVKAVLYNS